MANVAATARALRAQSIPRLTMTGLRALMTNWTTPSTKLKC